MVDDAVARITGQVVKSVANGKPPEHINPNDSNILKQAQKQQTAQQQTKPIPTNDKTAASAISTALQKPGIKLDLTAESYPFSKQKKDRDPRHPSNKGVSARPGFVGN